MNRLFAFALVAAIGNAPVAFAGESLVATGTRHVQQLAAAESAAGAATVASSPTVPPADVAGQRPAVSYQTDQAGNLSKSGHSKMTKALIYAAIGVGFGVSAWEIDRHVLNITPSSLGQRKD